MRRLLSAACAIVAPLFKRAADKVHVLALEHEKGVSAGLEEQRNDEVTRRRQAELDRDYLQASLDMHVAAAKRRADGM